MSPPARSPPGRAPPWPPSMWPRPGPGWPSASPSPPAIPPPSAGVAPPTPAGPASVAPAPSRAATPPRRAAAVVDGVGDRALDGAVEAEPAGRARLWRYREAHTEAINAAGVPLKLDVTLPAGELAGFLSEVPGAVERVAPGARCVLFGHAADGNVHVNVLGTADPVVEDTVLRLVGRLGGSISSEHGIGPANRPRRRLDPRPAQIAVFP